MPTFSITNQGMGVLCMAMCRALSQAGAKVVVLDLRVETAEILAAEPGNGAIDLACDVLDKASVETAAQAVLAKFGCVDTLINSAGGNKPQ